MSEVTNTDKKDHTLPVSVVQSSLLELGRAIMVKGGWLPSDEWNLTASLDIRFESLAVRPPSQLSGNQSTFSARIRGADAGASDWLSRVAFVLCQEPMPKYHDKKLLCKGIKLECPVDAKVQYGQESFHLDQFDKSGAWARWHIAPIEGERSNSKNCTGPTNLTSPGPTEPMWSAGTAFWGNSRKVSRGMGPS